MTPAQQRKQQDRITAEATLTAVVLLRAFIAAGAPLAGLAELVSALYPSVVRGRRLSHGLAVESYLLQHPSPSTAIRPLAETIDPPHYEPAALRQALERTTQKRERLTGEDSTERGRRLVVADASAAVARHIEMAPRETTMYLVEADDEALGWARVASGRETCAFCTLLISRGPVYKSKAVAERTTVRSSKGEGRRYHDRCDCIAVPVFDEERWPGRQQWLDAERLWIDSTRGLSGAEARKAFRRAVEERKKQRQAAA